MPLNNTIIVSSVTKLISCLNARSGPALTVYSAERVELGGPVTARWITKIANYLQNEAGAPLFGDEEPHPARLHTRIEPWQQILWEVTARCLGWEILDTPRLLPGDVVVGADVDGLLARAAAAGAHALAQPAAHLAFAWDGPPPRAYSTPSRRSAHSPTRPTTPPPTWSKRFWTRPWQAPTRTLNRPGTASRCYGAPDTAPGRSSTNGPADGPSSSSTPPTTSPSTPRPSWRRRGWRGRSRFMCPVTIDICLTDLSGFGWSVLPTGLLTEFWAPSAGPTKQRIGGQFSIFSNHSEQDHSPIVGAFGPQ